MRQLLSLCWFALFTLWVPIAAGQGSLPAPVPDQSPAQVPTVSQPPVWVNTQSKVYHRAETRWYGRTGRGKYLSETEALAEGDRAARNEHRPQVLLALSAAPPPTPAPETLAASVVVTTPQAELFPVCVAAVAAQSDLAKLATLRERGANPRLKRIMYYLARARAGGADPAGVIDKAQQQNGSADTPRAGLVKASLLRNLKICDGLGLLTPGNTMGLRRG